jgi:hypothetical protein
VPLWLGGRGVKLTAQLYTVPMSDITSLFERFLDVVLIEAKTRTTLFLPHLKTRHKSETKNVGRGDNIY